MVILALTVFARTLPLYLIIFLGYLLGRKRPGTREVFATLLIYFVSPVVVVHGILHSQIGPSTFALPVVFFALGCAISSVAYYASGARWADSTRNILAFASGTGNTGYFGLPVAVVLFGNQAIAPVVLACLGTIFFENTLGYYFTARGSFTIRQSLNLMLRLPPLYAAILALCLKLFGVGPGETFDEMSGKFIGTYSIVGMMLIGVGLSQIKNVATDLRFLVSCLAVKFLVWPGSMLILTFLDRSYWQLFSGFEHRILILLACAPIAAITVAYAAQLNAQPEKAALVVIVSTLVAMVLIPIVGVLLV